MRKFFLLCHLSLNERIIHASFFSLFQNFPSSCSLNKIVFSFHTNEIDKSSHDEQDFHDQKNGRINILWNKNSIRKKSQRSDKSDYIFDTVKENKISWSSSSSSWNKSAKFYYSWKSIQTDHQENDQFNNKISINDSLLDSKNFKEKTSGSSYEISCHW